MWAELMLRDPNDRLVVSSSSDDASSDADDSSELSDLLRGFFFLVCTCFVSSANVFNNSCCLSVPLRFLELDLGPVRSSRSPLGAELPLASALFLFIFAGVCTVAKAVR